MSRPAVVKFGSDDEAVAIANDCPFGLGSSVFSGSRARARAIGARLEVRTLQCCTPCRPGAWLGGRVRAHCCRPAAALRARAPSRLAVPPSPATQAGMTSLNDFATTYMCQSLPFGGVKHSGFDRFAGIEGLRGMCIPKVRSAPPPPRLPYRPRGAAAGVPTRPRVG